MAQNTLIARAGRGLLDVLMLLMRGVVATCTALGSFIMFAWRNSEEDTDEASELTDAERQMRELDPNFKNGGYYNYDRY